MHNPSAHLIADGPSQHHPYSIKEFKEKECFNANSLPQPLAYNTEIY